MIRLIEQNLFHEMGFGMDVSGHFEIAYSIEATSKIEIDLVG